MAISHSVVEIAERAESASKGVISSAATETTIMNRIGTGNLHCDPPFSSHALGTFLLLQGMYDNVPAPVIRGAINSKYVEATNPSLQPKGNELTLAVMKICHAVKSETVWLDWANAFVLYTPILPPSSLSRVG